ncbi:unnamed protein product [Didymodactylos carnosus]|uniref:NACHT domain-containing protein n=1 Tax=Didymodactylos carnosus TaxID=1234261 RepID=A0A8S2J6M8_9BILA|nr:unnamed protein product [Didymodactylos carnosus]CAF3783518.1 unnamed protein product [Didymodactylos carnosus]
MEVSVFDTIRRLHAYKHRISSIQSRLSDDNDLNGVISTVEVLSKETSSAADEWTHLFLRRLNRTLMWVEYVCDRRDAKEEGETFVLKDPWISYREDCQCIREHRSPQEDPAIWSHFTLTVEFENELKRRQQQFEEAHGARKTMRELYDKYKEFLKEYLDSCISFHSTLPVRGLTIENVIQTVQVIYGQEGTTLPDLPQSITEKIDIPLQSPSSHLVIGDVGVLEKGRSIKPSESAFIPSGEDIFIFWKGIINVPFFLEKYRWSVILGDPGSGRTTLLRWILLQAARAFSNEEKPQRLPILIRIGELITWLEVQPNAPSLFDYIGHHTWFGSFYAHEKHASAMLEFILHGHAILLFDGLDEVSDYAQRQKIVSLIEKFAEDHVRSPGNISVNDDSAAIVDWGGLFYESPALVQGNQIIVTSRMVGYRLFPLMGKQFMRFILRELTGDEAKKFIDNWFFEVNYAIGRSIESLDLVKPNNKTEGMLKEKAKITHSFLQSANEKIWSHPLLLSLALPFVHRQSAERILTSRVLLYETTVKSALAASFTFDPTIRLDIEVANSVLHDMAGHLHNYCPSGLIDTFDLRRLSFVSLKTFYNRKNISLPFDQLKFLVEQFIQKLNSNVGYVAALGLDVYGFVHRTFQEYFVAMSIVNPLYNEVQISPTSMGERVFSLVMKQNFREPLALAIGWINSHWLSKEFDFFCISLMEKTVESVPVGVILLFDVLEEFSNAPSADIMRRIFDCVLISSRDKFLWDNISGRFNRSATGQNFVKTLLHQGIHKERLCQFLFEHFDYRTSYLGPNIPPWLSEPEFLELLFADEGEESMETMKDMASRTLAFKESFRSNVLADYLLEQDVTISEMHVSVLSVIISLCGGIRLVEVTEDEEYSIEFDASDMYRSTPLSKMLMEYFADDQTEASVRLQNLAEKCEEILSRSHKDDLSRRVVDACVALICLRGVGCPTFYQRFGCYLSLPRALYRLKLVFSHLREYYKSITAKRNPNKDRLNISREFLLDSHRPQSVALAMCVAYERMPLMSMQKAVPLGYSFNSDRFTFCSTRFLKILGSLHLNPQDDDDEKRAEGKHSYQLLHNHPLFLVAFVPLRLQPLFERLILSDRLDKQADTYENEKVPYIVLLSEALLQLNNVQDNTARPLLLLEVLGDLVQLYKLDGYSDALTNLIWREENRFPSADANASELLERTVAELLQREKNRCFDAQNILGAQQADLQLYTASISTAYLSELTETRKEFLEQAKVTTRAIQDAYLRLLCFRHIKEIVRRWVDTSSYYTMREELFIEINRLSVNMPLLMSALLVAMYQCGRDPKEVALESD